MARAVLDTSALLALLLNESGADEVMKVIDDSLVSSVNLAELISKLVANGASPASARQALDIFRLEVSDFTRPMAEAVGSMVERTRSGGLSLGHRACLALAASVALPAYTADRAWATINPPCTVVLIR